MKFTFERYKGAAAKLLKEKVAAVEIVDPHRVRFRLKEPWPDFMTFYATPATGAGWIVPKKYIEKVGDEGFKKAPVGAGPYKFASFNPGVELVFEAHDRYWRKAPAVKRLVWKVVPEDVTRLAMLKRGEADVAYSLRGPLGEEVGARRGSSSFPPSSPARQWLDFGPLQWEPKSPWHDRRVRLAAALAFDENAHQPGGDPRLLAPTGSIIPSAFEYALAIPRVPVRSGARGSSWPRPAIRTASTPATTRATGRIRAWPRPSPTTWARWASGPGPPDGARRLPGQWKDKKNPRDPAGRRRRPRQCRHARPELHGEGGPLHLGQLPDIDDLFVQQAPEPIPSAARLLHQIQRLAHERVIAAPLWELGFLNAAGPRVEESGLGLIAYFPTPRPTRT